MKPNKSESTIQKEVIDYLDAIGAKVFPITVSAGMQRGTPDILACWKGKFIGIEVKQQKKKPTKIQLAQLELIEKAGGITAVVRGYGDLHNLNHRLIGLSNEKKGTDDNGR